MINYSITMRSVNSNLLAINQAKSRINLAKREGKKPAEDDLNLVMEYNLPLKFHRLPHIPCFPSGMTQRWGQSSHLTFRLLPPSLPSSILV